MVVVWEGKTRNACRPAVNMVHAAPQCPRCPANVPTYASSLSLGQLGDSMALVGAHGEARGRHVDGAVRLV